MNCRTSHNSEGWVKDQHSTSTGCHQMQAWFKSPLRLLRLQFHPERGPNKCGKPKKAAAQLSVAGCRPPFSSSLLLLLLQTPTSPPSLEWWWDPATQWRKVTAVRAATRCLSWAPAPALCVQILLTSDIYRLVLCFLCSSQQKWALLCNLQCAKFLLLCGFCFLVSSNVRHLLNIPSFNKAVKSVICWH